MTTGVLLTCQLIPSLTLAPSTLKSISTLLENNANQVIFWLFCFHQIADVFTKSLTTYRFLLSKSKLRVLSRPFSLTRELKDKDSTYLMTLVVTESFIVGFGYLFDHSLGQIDQAQYVMVHIIVW